MIPAYNEEENLARSVSSVLRALLAVREEFEVVVVDDGSRDATLHVAHRLAKENPRVRVMQHPGGENRGVAATRNLGLSSSHGAYLAFLDADDICEPTRFAASVQVLDERDEIDGVLVPVEVVFDSQKADTDRLFLPALLDHDPLIEVDSFAYATLSGKSSFHISNVLFRRTLLDRSGMFDPNRRLGEEDLELWLRMAVSGSFTSLSHGCPQVQYRRHPGNNWAPTLEQVFRDLDVVGGVLKWAQLQRHIAPRSIAQLSEAFDSKWMYCMQLARDRNWRSAGLSAGALALRVRPSLALRRIFWANVGRVALMRADSTGR